MKFIVQRQGEESILLEVKELDPWKAGFLAEAMVVEGCYQCQKCNT